MVGVALAEYKQVYTYIFYKNKKKYDMYLTLLFWWNVEA